jgi:multidrug resistance protein, MATE family
VQLAGHQIALNVASFTYMVPLGICSAAAVRVGHAMGAQDAYAAARAGWMAIFFGALFMSCSGLVLFLFARPIARLYTPEIDVVNAGATLLLVAAVFQLFDGLQVVATGALRGAGNTRIPMLANFVGYWVIGLPLGAFLCFRVKMGAVGMWLGLCLALVLIGSVLVGVWQAEIKRLTVTKSTVTGL